MTIRSTGCGSKPSPNQVIMFIQFLCQKLVQRDLLYILLIPHVLTRLDGDKHSQKVKKKISFCSLPLPLPNIFFVAKSKALFLLYIYLDFFRGFFCVSLCIKYRALDCRGISTFRYHYLYPPPSLPLAFPRGGSLSKSIQYWCPGAITQHCLQRFQERRPHYLVCSLIFVF